MASNNEITDLVRRLASLEEARADAKKEAKKAGLDPAALRRAALWNPDKAQKRQVQAAIDHQYRYHAGGESKPATIPPGSELAKAADYHAKGLTVRAIADRLGCGKSKAHTLVQQAELFGVRQKPDKDNAADDLELPQFVGQTTKAISNG